MELPARCLDCPLAWRDALILVGVSVALVLFGRVLLEIPRRILRGFGLLGLGGALVVHAFGLSTIALVGISWGGAPRRAGRDALFALCWLVLSAAAFALARRIGRTFPARGTRLRVVEGTRGDAFPDEFRSGARRRDVRRRLP